MTVIKINKWTPDDFTVEAKVWNVRNVDGTVGMRQWSVWECGRVSRYKTVHGNVDENHETVGMRQWSDVNVDGLVGKT